MSPRRLSEPKSYTFEEWIEFVRLIRLTSNRGIPDEDEDEGLVEWDWIGEDSPLMSGLGESEWLLQRLCESLVRLAKKPSVSEGKPEIAASDVKGNPEAASRGQREEKAGAGHQAAAVRTDDYRR
jgi:potassium channel subfamily K